MHYVRFAGTQEQERGDFEEIVRYADKAGAVGIVTELRDDLTEIDAATYAAERAAIEEYNKGLPQPVTPPVPDAPRFKIAAYEYLGAEAFVAPLSGYIAPTLDALNEGNWEIARQIIGYATQAGALTGQQYSDLNELMADHAIPEA